MFTALTLSSLAISPPRATSASRRSGLPQATTADASGWRTRSLASERARCPSSLTARTSAMGPSSPRSMRASSTSGYPARCTEDGASGPQPRTTRLSHISSVRNGVTGAITRRHCTSAWCRVAKAARSPSQKRLRERRTYQFERSSQNASTALVIARRVVGVERGAGVARELGAARDDPAVERVVALRPTVRLGPERPEALRVGVQDEEAVGVPEREQAPRDVAGRPVAEVHVLARVLAGEHPAASRRRPSSRLPLRARIALPHDLCIARPCSSCSFS